MLGGVGHILSEGDLVEVNVVYGRLYKGKECIEEYGIQV